MVAMDATHLLAGYDFLKRNKIATPLPKVRGALPADAREPFSREKLNRPFDLLVMFTIGDFPASDDCSCYYDPGSAWYNVFYGAYGIRSYKDQGVAWGFKSNGDPDYDEMLKVPELDYNDLTAGALGCPPEKRCFKGKFLDQNIRNGWAWADVQATIPSGLHDAKEAVKKNAVDLTYYPVFGIPDPAFLAGKSSYEPVDMRGQMFFKQAAQNITLVWGGMCPNTPEGQELLKTIIDTMGPEYGV
jgi:hypothetical protein